MIYNRSSSAVPLADYLMCSGLIIADMRRTKSLRVMNKVLKIAGISKLHLGLDTGNSQVFVL